MDYDRALLLEPGLKAALLGRGRCRYFLRRFDEAIEDWEAFLEIAGDSPAAAQVALSIEKARAARRHEEMARRGDALDYAHVAEELMRRDKIDSERADSPQRPADDAVLIDTEDLGVEEVARRVLDLMGSGQ